MPKINHGIQVENDLVKALNGKTYNELEKNLKHMVKEIYNDVDQDDIIRCQKILGFIKPDISITVREETHYISVKSGCSSSIHQEDVFSFMKFLVPYIPRELLKKYLLYHFGDGTYNGSGNKRLSHSQLVELYRGNLIEVNKAFNKDQQFIIDVANRCLFKGTDSSTQPAEYIYHGDVEYGVLISQVQMKKYILTKRKYLRLIDNFFHIGPFVLRPHARYINKYETHPESRFKIEIEWKTIIEDMKYISNRFEG